MKRTYLPFGMAVSLLVSCLPEPRSVSTSDGGPWPAPTLRANDGAGSVSALDALPRRPRLRIDGLLDDPASLPVLVRGPLDAALLADAARAPWSSETTRRFVPCDLRREGTAVVLTPSNALASGEALVLVIAAWARDLRGLPVARPIGFELRVREQQGGAALASSFPADGTTAVPSALASFDVRFDDEVFGLESLELVDDSGQVVPTRTTAMACSAMGFLPGSCARLVPLVPLAFGRVHELRVPESVRDRFGDGPADSVPSFIVQTSPDSSPPTPLALVCATDELSFAGFCLLVQDVRLVIRARFARPTRVYASYGDLALVGLDRFGDVVLEWLGLVPGTSMELSIVSEGLDGTREHSSAAFTTHEPLAGVQIAEVRADAVGDEPAQEYVELWNSSEVALDLGGFRLSDAGDKEGDILPSPSWLDADARLLVVSDAFDPLSLEDARPPPGAALARIGSSIGSGGLSNSGEPLYLRDTQGRRIAEMPPVPAPGPGVCIARLALPGRTAEDGTYGVAAHGSCTPGTP